jgi:PhoH-like ATPase
MCPIYDAFDVLKLGKGDGKKLVSDNPRIKVEPLTYIRGRSIHNQFLLIDETQNLTPLEIKTIITRAGEGTKIVLTGDVEQIDNPYVDRYSNGLAVVMNGFKDSSLAAHIVMTKGVRSKLADEAAKRI